MSHFGRLFYCRLIGVCSIRDGGHGIALNDLCHSCMDWAVRPRADVPLTLCPAVHIIPQALLNRC